MSDPRDITDYQPHQQQGSACFAARVGTKPFNPRSVIALLTVRPELAIVRHRWIWKLIAEGTVAKKKTSLAFYISSDLTPGTYDIITNDRITVVYHDSPYSANTVYHSSNFQEGSFTLVEADPQIQRLQGHFSFSMSAINFQVTEGVFDVTWD